MKVLKWLIWHLKTQTPNTNQIVINVIDILNFYNVFVEKVLHGGSTYRPMLLHNFRFLFFQLQSRIFKHPDKDWRWWWRYFTIIVWSTSAPIERAKEERQTEEDKRWQVCLFCRGWGGEVGIYPGTDVTFCRHLVHPLYTYFMFCQWRTTVIPKNWHLIHLYVVFYFNSDKGYHHPYSPSVHCERIAEYRSNQHLVHRGKMNCSLRSRVPPLNQHFAHLDLAFTQFNKVPPPQGWPKHTVHHVENVTTCGIKWTTTKNIPFLHHVQNVGAWKTTPTPSYTLYTVTKCFFRF